MPSLKSQLQHLQTPVSRSLGVEREHASLLFDRKEAASFSSEEFYQLGMFFIPDFLYSLRYYWTATTSKGGQVVRR